MITSKNILNMIKKILQAPETPDHFLQCPHPTRIGQWEDFQQVLQKLFLKHDLPQAIPDLIAEGYRLSRDNARPSPLHIRQQPSIQMALQQQASLGWKQLLYGRIVEAWQTLLHTKAPRINSTNFFSKIIHHGWTVLITIWQIRNMHLHPPQEHLTDRTQLQAIVENIFHTVQLDSTLRDLLQYTTIEQVMSKTIREIRKWIKHSTNHIQAHQEGAKQ